jgi:hypothetical protein
MSASAAATLETLFRDVRVFDGRSGRLAGQTDVLVRGQRVAAIGCTSPAPGTLADLLLVDGDPVTDIKLLEDPERRRLVIMKEGQIHKNTLAR